jgi:selenocysteine lyase/cysteine desulfurase
VTASSFVHTSLVDLARPNARAMHAEFALRDDLIYLNHAMASPWPLRTANAIKAFIDDQVRQGQAGFGRWLAVEVELRLRLRRLLNADSVDDIALVKNTSEGLSMVAYGLSWRPGDNIVIPAKEFPSNRVVWESLAAHGVEVRKADILAGEDPEDAIMALADEETRLIAVSSVHFATGLRMDLERLGEFCRGYQILFCIDAIQSLGAFPMDVHRVHADFVVAGCHKWLMAPEGLGVFWSRPEARDALQLRQFGWHMVQEHLEFERDDWQIAHTARRLEAGTMNTAGMVGLNASLSLLEEVGLEVVTEQILAKTGFLLEALAPIPGIELISDQRRRRRSGIVTFRSSATTSEDLHGFLKDKGIFCARRSGGIRLSPHFYTPDSQLGLAVDLIRAGASP